MDAPSSSSTAQSQHSEAEHSGISDSVDSHDEGREAREESEDLTSPWPHLDAFYGPVLTKRRVTVRGRMVFKGHIQCKLCHGKVSYNTLSTYTLKSHYNNQHHSESKDLCAAIAAGSKRGRTFSGDTAGPGTSKRMRQHSIESAFAAESLSTSFKNSAMLDYVHEMNFLQDVWGARSPVTFANPHKTRVCCKLCEVMEIPRDQTTPSPSTTTTSMDRQLEAVAPSKATYHLEEEMTMPSPMEDLSHPWPHLETFFGPVVAKKKVIERGKANYKGSIACKKCKANISFNTYSLFSLKSHCKNVHPNMLKDLIAAISAGSRRGRSISSSACDTDSRGKRQQQPSMKSTFAGGSFNNDKAQELFYRMMIGEMLPARTTESPLMTNFLKFLQPQFKLPSRQTYIRTLKKRTEACKAELTNILDGVKYVATTADIWTSHNCSFLGMTAHWIDASSFERKKAVITCKELPVVHNYDVLSSIMQGVHQEFHIEAKVTSMTTDNGSNFVKAFNVFGDSEYTTGTCAQRNSDEDNDTEERHEVQPVDVAQLLEKNHEESTWHLPNHHRCAAHMLNLLATVDLEKVPNWSTGSHPYFSKVKAKAMALWYKQNQSPTTAATIKREVGRKLRTPSITHWNSLYDSMEVLSEVLNTKLAQINMICTENSIASFTQNDKDIINEYLTVMKPVVTSLNKLQSEKEAYMGVLLPTLYVVRSRLEAMKTKPLKYARPMLDYLLDNPLSKEKKPKGFKARFSSFFDDMDLLMATAIHPFFKLPVVHLLNPDKVDNVKSRLLDEVRERVKAAMETTEANSAEEDEGDDFFKDLRIPGPTAIESSSHTTLSNKLGIEYDAWSSEKEKTSKQLEQAMFPVLSRASWVDVFLKYNTAIPSTAAVERLFSQGSDIMKAQSASLTSETFEQLAFMKGNMDLLKMKLFPEDLDCDVWENHVEDSTELIDDMNEGLLGRDYATDVSQSGNLVNGNEYTAQQNKKRKVNSSVKMVSKAVQVAEEELGCEFDIFAKYFAISLKKLPFEKAVALQMKIKSMIAQEFQKILKDKKRARQRHRDYHKQSASSSTSSFSCQSVAPKASCTPELVKTGKSTPAALTAQSSLTNPKDYEKSIYGGNHLASGEERFEEAKTNQEFLNSRDCSTNMMDKQNSRMNESNGFDSFAMVYVDVAKDNICDEYIVAEDNACVDYEEENYVKNEIHEEFMKIETWDPHDLDRIQQDAHTFKEQYDTDGTFWTEVKEEPGD